MTDQRPEMAVIADLPADLRHALSKDFALVDEPLEGANAIAIACHHGPDRADEDRIRQIGRRRQCRSSLLRLRKAES